MQSNNVPETYTDILTLAKYATIVTWFRSGKSLNLVLDNVSADRRTCVDLRIESGKCGRVEVRTLKGFNSVKNKWGEYCAPAASKELPDKRGLKQLLAWVSSQALAKVGYPNPESFSLYRTAGEVRKAQLASDSGTANDLQLSCLVS